jgi:hypothetical protein
MIIRVNVDYFPKQHQPNDLFETRSVTLEVRSKFINKPITQMDFMLQQVNVLTMASS